MSKRQTYTREFKLEAVRLLEQSDQTAVELAIQLGVRRNQLYKWQEEVNRQGSDAFPGSGRREASEENEVVRLRRELKRVKEERDILKKATQFFAKELE